MLAAGTELGRMLWHNAPPVLWFGDLSSLKGNVSLQTQKKESEGCDCCSCDGIGSVRSCGEGREQIILTVAANPSLHEYFKSVKDLQPENRLAQFPVGNSVKDSDVVKAINGYNNYFKNKPYTKWFGGQTKPTNLEAFLNGLGASFYNGGNKYKAVHIDLFPFATKSKFGVIKDAVEKELFVTGFSSMILRNLIEVINPVKVVMVGGIVGEYFQKHVCPDLYCKPIPQRVVYESRLLGPVAENFKTKLWDRYDALVTSCNLGNPIGFTTEDLNTLGRILSGI